MNWKNLAGSVGSLISSIGEVSISLSGLWGSVFVASSGSPEVFAGPGWNVSSAVLAGMLPPKPPKRWLSLHRKGHCRRRVNVPRRMQWETGRATIWIFCLWLLRLSEMTWTNSVSVLTHKSIWRKPPGHHVSDVPLLISVSLIADLKKLKKKQKKKNNSAIRICAITPSAHKTHPLFWFNPIRHPLKLQLFSGKAD